MNGTLRIIRNADDTFRIEAIMPNEVMELASSLTWPVGGVLLIDAEDSIGPIYMAGIQDDANWTIATPDIVVPEPLSGKPWTEVRA